MLCQYMSLGRIYYLFFWVSVPVPLKRPRYCFFVSCLYFCFYYLQVCHILRLFTICDIDPESATNIFSIYLLIVYFFTQVRHLQKELFIVYIFSGISFFPLFIFVICFFIPADIFFVTLLATSRALFPILILAVIFFNGVSILLQYVHEFFSFSILKVSNIVSLFTTVVEIFLHLTYVKRLL